MTIKEAREEKGLSRKEVCDWLKIPYRTLQSWELGDRECPEWAETLIVEKILQSERKNESAALRGQETVL